MSDFVATHHVPANGLIAFAEPVPEPVAIETLGGGLPVVVLEARADGWSLVAAGTGWTGWVDGRALLPVAPAPDAGHGVGPTPVATTGAAPAGAEPEASDTRSRLAWALTALVLVGVAAAAGTYLLTRGDAPTPAVASGTPSSTAGEEAEQPGGTEGSTQQDAGSGDLDALATRHGAPDWGSVDAGAPVTTGPGALLAGSPDRTAERHITDALAAAGLDTTGLQVSVLPITGTADRLVHVPFSDDLPLVTEGAPEDVDPMAVLAAAARAVGVDRFVFTYSGVDDEGPLELTLTGSFAELLALPEDGDPRTVLQGEVVRP